MLYMGNLILVCLKPGADFDAHAHEHEPQPPACTPQPETQPEPHEPDHKKEADWFNIETPPDQQPGLP